MIGLTGGVCTGKTLVAGFLEQEGLEVVDLDGIARWLLKRGKEGYRRVVEAFGVEVLREDGEVDRRKLGKLVFRDPGARERLEGLLHPLIEEEMQRRLALAGGDVVLDSPLLVEKGHCDRVDLVVVVYAPESLQVERMLKRDRLSREEAMARIRAQTPIEEKIALADYVIDNSRSVEYTREQTLRVLADIRKKSRYGREEGKWRSSTSRN